MHGLGGSHLNWMGVAPGLARTGRVLALDLIGFGFTPRAGRSSSMSSNRHMLSRFIATMTERPVVLVGNSMGAALSLLQNAYEPTTADGLVLTSPALPWVDITITSAPHSAASDSSADATDPSRTATLMDAGQFKQIRSAMPFRYDLASVWSASEASSNEGTAAPSTTRSSRSSARVRCATAIAVGSANSANGEPSNATRMRLNMVEPSRPVWDITVTTPS